MERVVDERVLKTMTRVSEVVGSIGEDPPVERPGHDLAVLAPFGRCRSLLGAIRVLLASNFVHEAVMLGRPLFTDSLALAEFADVDEKGRGERVIRWALASLADIGGLYRDAGSRGDDTIDELAELTRRRAQLEAYARRKGFRTRHWRR